MHFGLQIPYAIPAERDDLLTWIRRAEAGPFRTVNIGERITYDNPDQTVVLAAAAALTSRVRLLTNVSVLPIHPPALAAKAFATIDRLCEGRLVITAGVGSRPEDFAASGSSYANRWQRLEWEVPNLEMLPSEYFRRQCWISFDPDEAMMAFTAQSPLVGADRIIWASDYPHPDAKFPGVTEELAEALDGLNLDQKRAITSESAIALYGIG